MGGRRRRHPMRASKPSTIGFFALFATAALLACGNANAGREFSALHPEEAYSDDIPPLSEPGIYSEFIQVVQRRLHEEGFAAGPVNGDFGTKTQAALAQFQIARALPASGQL